MKKKSASNSQEKEAINDASQGDVFASSSTQEPSASSRSEEPKRSSLARNSGSGAGSGRKRVLVVGAGFSGLTSAFYLSKAGFEVEVLEMKPGPGGMIARARADHGLVETAANGLVNTRIAEDLFSEIGCPMQNTKKESSARYIFRDGKPRRRLSFGEIFQAAGLGLRYLFDRESLKPESGESLRAWTSRTLGPALGQAVVEPALQGVYAGDPSRLSATLLVGRLFSKKPKVAPVVGEPTEAQLQEMEPQLRKETELRLKRDRKRRLKAKGTVAPPEGMSQLIEKLEDHLKAQGVRFRYGARALPTAQDAAKRPIVVATSFSQARELVEGIDPERARAMAAIPMLPLLTVTAFFRGPSPRPGFGMLFPPNGRHQAMGVLFNSSIFENRVGNTEISSETWILGGALAPQGLMSASDESVLAIVDSEREAAFGDKGERVEAAIVRWPEALPHYTRELEKRLPYFVENRSNVFLIGNYLGEIGLSKILERAARLPFEVAERGEWS